MNKLLWAILLVLLGIAFPVAWIIIAPLLVIIVLMAIMDASFAPFQRRSKQRVFTKEFSISDKELFKAMIRTIGELGYKLEKVEDNRLITFKTKPSISTTSGQEGTAIIVPTGTNVCNVQITMSYKGQLWDWGEGEKIGKKILSKLSETLNTLEKE